MYLGNRTIGLHLLRGVLGVAALYVWLSTAGRAIWPTLVLLPAGLYLLKGCPMCWTVGLIETVVMTVRRRKERKLASASCQPVANISAARKRCAC
jgi:hypothetical protein